MKVLPFNNTQRVIIDPGEFYVCSQPEIISTLLGSCIAACLYDPVNRVFGMNHFLLAYRNHPKGTSLVVAEEGRYGIYAMEQLINALMKKGANKLNLQAKCFGGGNVLPIKLKAEHRPTVGEMNVEFIKEFLLNENIPLVSACLGGCYGRNVHFVGSDFSVFVQKINQVDLKLVTEQEQQYWKTHATVIETATNKPEYW